MRVRRYLREPRIVACPFLRHNPPEFSTRPQSTISSHEASSADRQDPSMRDSIFGQRLVNRGLCLVHRSYIAYDRLAEHAKCVACKLCRDMQTLQRAR